MKIGKVIQSLRERQDMSQKDLADKIEISYSVMNRIESGERPARDEEVRRIAKVLDVSTDYLLGVSDNKIQITEESMEGGYTVPKEFTSANEAREYVSKHQIFGFNGFDADKLSDEDIVKFANELMDHMDMVSLKYMKKNNYKTME